MKKGDLESLQLVVRHQGRLAPTVGGVLLFGRDRLKHFPEAFIRSGCFAGVDKQTIVGSQEIKSLPVVAIEEALRFVRRNTRRGLRIERTQSAEAWEFPLTALREAIIKLLACCGPSRIYRRARSRSRSGERRGRLETDWASWRSSDSGSR